MPSAPPRGDDRCLVDRIAFRQLEAHNRVPCLVIGRLFLLLGGQNHRAPFGPHHDLVLGRLEIGHCHGTAPDARRCQRRLIHKVRQISARETRRAPRDDAQINIRAKRRLACVHAQDFLAALDVRIAHRDLTVKTARAQQRGIKHILAVCRRDDDDALVRFKAVHLDKELVQRLLAFVIAAAIPGTPVAADSIDLVDEDDARRVLFGLIEHVAHAAGADAHEHLDEVGA